MRAIKAELIYDQLVHIRMYYRAPRMVPILNGYTNCRAVSTKVSVLVAKNGFLFCLTFSCTKQPCFNVVRKNIFCLSTVIRT